MSTMPVQKPGKSKQDYGTPWELIDAIEMRFGEKFTMDLAASEDNAKAPLWIDEAHDSLSCDWSKLGGLLWLNPPYEKIAPWAEKCYQDMILGARVMLLTPASVGSNWYQKYVHGKAYVMALNPRLTFEGETTCYPKDLCLSYFYAGMAGFEVWRWR